MGDAGEFRTFGSRGGSIRCFLGDFGLLTPGEFAFFCSEGLVFLARLRFWIGPGGDVVFLLILPAPSAAFDSVAFAEVVPVWTTVSFEKPSEMMVFIESIRSGRV